MTHTAEQVFEKIYSENTWGSQESVSGRGSELANTQQLIRELPILLRDFSIRTMLDLPCGDFNWMRHVDLAGIDYCGADIVQDLVERNQAQYGHAQRHFKRLNILLDALPRVDLIFCRDCLFHFSQADVFKALDAFANSGSTWLLTTTMPYRGLPRNFDITTGGWTPLNLEMEPYHLPAPTRFIIEGNVTDSVSYRVNGQEWTAPQNDRCMALWPMHDIKLALARRQTP